MAMSAVQPVAVSQLDRAPERTKLYSRAVRNGSQIPSLDNASLFSNSSTPATPASIGDTNTDDVSFRSRSSSMSPLSVKRPPNAPDMSDPPSPKSTFFPNYGPPEQSPTFPPRRDSRNRPNLHLTPRDERKYVESNSPSPSPSPKFGRFTPSSSPLLPPKRPSITPSPLATNAPRTVSPSDDVSPAQIVQPESTSAPQPSDPEPRRRARGMTEGVASPTADIAPQLKSSISIPDLSGAAASQRVMSSTYKPDRVPNSREQSQVFRREPPMPWVDSSEARGSIRSVRSAWTNGSAMTYESSNYNDASEFDTERSSISGSFEMIPRVQNPSPEEQMTIEDTIDLYAEFEIDTDLERKIDTGIEEVEEFIKSRVTTMQQSYAGAPALPAEAMPPLPTAHRPSTAQSVETRTLGASNSPPPALPRSSRNSLDNSRASDGISQVSTLLEQTSRRVPPPIDTASSRSVDPPQGSPLRLNPVNMRPTLADTNSSMRYDATDDVPRDIYGFKKASQYITEEQYDEWNEEYTVYLERRRRKWEVLMKQYGLTTDQPIRFPPKSEKVKRFIRKGIPPDWRGAAWFWYAGGPDKLAREPGLYRQLVGKAQNGELSETDKDSIERDLHRTFPDNIKFKHEQDSMDPNGNFPGKAVGPTRSTTNREPRMLSALRRVLHAFAIHNPNIGYCQSLNFLAGLLLLFLDEDEEKSFVLLNILTNTHLPGIHAKLLEANVDVGVLMQFIQEEMPAIWAKIDDVEEQPTIRTRKPSQPAPVGIRLPTVSLATTSWFMSCFLGNMPVESVLRVWDMLFYEGSKSLFRVSLAIFKTNEVEIRNTREQLEIFQVVQTLPRRLLDINALLEACFKRRTGFGNISQETIDTRRRDRRRLVRRDRDEKDWERMQQVQEQNAKNPLGPLNLQAQQLSRDAGRVIAVQAPPGNASATKEAKSKPSIFGKVTPPRSREVTPPKPPTPPTPPSQQFQVSRKEVPRRPAAPSMVLGPVQQSSNPINLPLSPTLPNVELPPDSPFVIPPIPPRGNPFILPPTPTTDQSRPSLDERGRPGREQLGGSPAGALRRAASRAKALKDRSRSRKRERADKARNWTDGEWFDAN